MSEPTVTTTAGPDGAAATPAHAHKACSEIVMHHVSNAVEARGSAASSPAPASVFTGDLGKDGKDATGVVSAAAEALLASVGAGAGVSESTHVAAAARSLGAYVAALASPSQLAGVDKQVTGACVKWLRDMLGLHGFQHHHVTAHAEDARVAAFQAAFQHLFAAYPTDGFLALPRAPVYYTSQAFPWDGTAGLVGADPAKRVCGRLGMPVDWVCRVQSDANNAHVMDVAALEELVSRDLAEGLSPFLVVATVGTPGVGHCDDIPALRSLCDRYGLWLHVEGPLLALLASGAVPKRVGAATTADSVTVQPADWLELPSTECITFLKGAVGELAVPRAAPLALLPVWLQLQHTGRAVLAERVRVASSLATFLWHSIEEAHKPSGVDQITPVLSVERVAAFADAPLTLTFRYCGPASVEMADDALSAINRELFTQLADEAAGAEVECVVVEGKTCFQFAPRLTAHLQTMGHAALLPFVHAFVARAAVVDNVLTLRDVFASEVANDEFLRAVPLATLGLGAVQYVPEYLDAAADEDQHDLDEVNTSLSQRLAEMDPIFSRGAIPGSGAVCVVVGVPGAPLRGEDVVRLVKLVSETKTSVEVSNKVIEGLSDVIKEKIVEAERALEEENIQSLYEEGLLRQLPVVGSVWNWFSPYKQQPVRGRTFDIRKKQLVATAIPEGEEGEEGAPTGGGGDGGGAIRAPDAAVVGAAGGGQGAAASGGESDDDGMDEERDTGSSSGYESGSSTSDEDGSGEGDQDEDSDKYLDDGGDVGRDDGEDEDVM